MSEPLSVGFLGCGQMATAIAGGLLSSQTATAESLRASGRSQAGRDAFAAATGVTPTTLSAVVVANSDVVVLAVKPKQILDLLDQVRDAWTPETLVISVAAGVSNAAMAERLPVGQPLVRVMPNTPCLVNAGASCFARHATATDEHAELTAAMLSPLGLVEEVEESLLDAVVGVSGSGPAYAYQIIEALSDGGVRQGLQRPLATRLAAQTLLGAAQMVLQTGKHPGELKDAVTSPGGTTIAALHALERGGLRGTLMNAVEAAAKRSRQMGKPKRPRRSG